MFKISRFIIWICSKFTRSEIEQIITALLDILKNVTLILNLKTISRKNTQITESSLLTLYHLFVTLLNPNNLLLKKIIMSSLKCTFALTVNPSYLLNIVTLLSLSQFI